MQDKALKRVNYVQIGYMMPLSLPNAVYTGNQMIKGRVEQNQIMNNRKSNNIVNINNCNLPQIRNSNCGTKPISSDSKKRVYRWSSHLNGSSNNLTNNNNLNNYNNLNMVNVNIVNKNIPAPRSNNRAGSIQPIGKGQIIQKQDFYGLQVNNLTNDFSPSLNIEKITPARTGKQFNSLKNVKKYK